jgi:spermidine synthase
MKPRITVASAQSKDGTQLRLIEHDGDYLIDADGLPLMSTRLHHSEEVMAELACVDLTSGAVALIGGLGMGYTLRATLDRLPADGQAIQVELVPEVVEWNRGPLGPFSKHPLDDPRTVLLIDDVAAAIRSHRGDLDAILLDVDNGPSSMVRERNHWLYGAQGMNAHHRALKKGGRLAIWAVTEEPQFEKQMAKYGFVASCHRIHARPGKRGHHAVYLGIKT